MELGYLAALNGELALTEKQTNTDLTEKQTNTDLTKPSKTITDHSTHEPAPRQVSPLIQTIPLLIAVIMFICNS